MKTIKSVLCSFLLIVIAGTLVTFATKSIISQKREELYGYQDKNDDNPTASNTNESTAGVQKGPMANVITKEKYMERISELQKQISVMWEGVSDTNSAMSAVRYEKTVWEAHLSEILQMYYDIQSASNIEALEHEKKAYEEQRRLLSQEAAKKAGEAIDGLEYNKEYVRLTKEKTYELIERYFKE